MPAILTEHTQFTDSAGKPFVNGTVTYGVQGADPDVSLITIYSDRGLTTVIANPQVLDANGRTANKVWVAGRYSILVKDLNAVQVYTNLDNGETADKGITVLENVSGGNTIVATAASTITAYEDLEQYTFRTAQVNTGAVTLNIDTVGAKAIVKNHDQAILPGEFEADQNINVSYNETEDVFEWGNQNVKTVALYEGTPVASATTTNIWVTDGDTVHVTGAVAITSFGTAPNVGAWKKVIFDGTPLLTDGANLNLPGGANITAAADDFAFVYAETTTLFKVLYFKADGTAVIPNITLGTPVASTSGTAFTFGPIPAGTKRITMNWFNGSTSGTSKVIFQLGDAGGLENTGYLGAGSDNTTGTNATDGFLIPGAVAANIYHGSIQFDLVDAAAFKWVARGMFAQSNTAQVNQVSGSKALSAELTQVSITTQGGTDTFDLGTINISYEG